MNRILTEPLLHFALLGASLFGLYSLRNPGSGSSARQIVVTAGYVDHLATAFARAWQRPPTSEELMGLIDDYVQEEVLSREAIKLGLDQDDTIIRRRLRQKMEFIAEDFAVASEPTETDLKAYFEKHSANFREEPRFTFRHVFLRHDRGSRLESDAAALLRGFTAADPETDPSFLGDHTLLPLEFVDEAQSSLKAQFGEGFADKLIDAQIGGWSGPIESAYGAHLVMVEKRTEGRIRSFEELRDQIKQALLADRRLRMNREFLNALLDQYEVTVEWPNEVRALRMQAVSVSP